MLSRGQEGILAECSMESQLCVHMSLGDSRGHLSQSKISVWQCLWHGHSQMLSARLSPLPRWEWATGHFPGSLGGITFSHLSAWVQMCYRC